MHKNLKRNKNMHFPAQIFKYQQDTMVIPQDNTEYIKQKRQGKTEWTRQNRHDKTNQPTKHKTKWMKLYKHPCINSRMF